jgi:hypothetical protein
MPDYGYLHRGEIVRHEAVTNSYYLKSVSLARTQLWGPVASCVPGLVKGDRVILGASGTSRDDLIILGKIGAEGIDIGDVQGLLDALGDKASAVDLQSVADQLDALAVDTGSLGDRVGVVEGRATTLESRATSVEGRATSLEGRATSLEGRATAVEGRATALEAARTYNRGDQDLYSHLIETAPRHNASAAVTLANGVGNLQLSYANRAFNFASLRAVVSTAGTGAGAAVAAVYVGTSRASLILHVTQAILLNALGEQLALFAGGGQAFNGFPYMALGILGSGYTVAPQVAATPAVPHAGVLNPAGQLTAVTKALGAWPATVDLTDGTWGSATQRAWMGLSP